MTEDPSLTIPDDETDGPVEPLDGEPIDYPTGPQDDLE